MQGRGSGPCSILKGKLPAKRARDPNGVEDGTLLVIKFSTASSSCTVRCKEEDDRRCYISLWCKIKSCYNCFVDLVTWMFLLLLRHTLLMFWCRRVDKRERKETRNEIIKYLIFTVAHAWGNAIDCNRRKTVDIHVVNCLNIFYIHKKNVIC